MSKVQHIEESEKEQKPYWERWGEIIMIFVIKYAPNWLKNSFKKIDKKIDGGLSFFMRHWGKTPFMIAMSKKVQYLGIEKLWDKGPKAFIYFFLFYLIRDTILYIIIPIFFAKVTTS
ncbi:hypothetical protein A9Q84_06725 [Halobacteriovorax marinus]|uniref:Uncharacterized protein n=1 Tax=Halobacteriovorax marinus TaxID=97084 RepID=A0A1Y5FGC2_9BACT|nr:hypothetical protein A9Q84_06725 [Halobacteriovorax marinus]